MALRWYSIVVDSLDVRAQARWWARVLDWAVIVDTRDAAVILAPDVTPGPLDDLTSWIRAGQGIVFLRVPERKSVKNRLHIDLTPESGDDGTDEVERLLRMGATRADVGQPTGEWTVLRDLEGNEFCVIPGPHGSR